MLTRSPYLHVDGWWSCVQDQSMHLLNKAWYRLVYVDGTRTLTIFECCVDGEVELRSNDPKVYVPPPPAHCCYDRIRRAHAVSFFIFPFDSPPRPSTFRTKSIGSLI